MPEPTSAARDFSMIVVQRLRAAGFQAYWAGGCVRDLLLGRDPKDYDVATDAQPDEVRQLFGQRRTLAIGASFGVISVLGPPGVSPIEVATFRVDAAYSDGRHPDQVSFSTPQNDAQRRDFTINGMFYDPIVRQVWDWVGGQQDLQDQLVRAIGNPHERFAEDKLRMMRAVRIATTYGFQLESTTADALRQHATELLVVSPERVSGELLRILAHPARAAGVELLDRCHLLSVILPEMDWMLQTTPRPVEWKWTIHLLDSLASDVDVVHGLAALLRFVSSDQEDSASRIRLEIGKRWRLPQSLSRNADWLGSEEGWIRRAQDANWPVVQRRLADPRGGELLRFARQMALVTGEGESGVRYCQQRLEELDWNPSPLISGDDLRAAGIPPGPRYREILDAIRDAQLRGEIGTADQAMARVRSGMWSTDDHP